MRAYYPYHDNHYYSQYRPTGQHNPGDPYTVRLRVGDREYPGVGYTVQAARHDAAAKAIDEIKQLGDCSTSEPQTENCMYLSKPPGTSLFIYYVYLVIKVRFIFICKINFCSV